MIESSAFDAGHGVGDGNGGQAAATIESIVSDGSHGILHTLKGEFLGDGYGTGILGVSIRHFRRIPFRNQVVVDAIHLAVIRAGQQGEGQQ